MESKATVEARNPGAAFEEGAPKGTQGGVAVVREHGVCCQLGFSGLWVGRLEGSWEHLFCPLEAVIWDGVALGKRLLQGVSEISRLVPVAWWAAFGSPLSFSESLLLHLSPRQWHPGCVKVRLE